MSTITEKIPNVLFDWLKREVKDADEGRNAQLSEFLDRKADLDKDFNDPSNINAGKMAGHYDRLGTWAATYRELGQEHEDYATARLAFCSLMFMSGNYRTQCLLQSSSAQEYQRLRRVDQPIGVDLRAIAKTELSNVATLDRDPRARLSDLVDRTLAVNELNFSVAKANFSAASESTVPIQTKIESAQQLQGQWSALAIAQIMVASSFRNGNYSLVPFFEPKSITDQSKLEFPLA
jgi:hypothetical protein